MNIVVVTHPNPFALTFHSEEGEFSKSFRTHNFQAPVPEDRIPEKIFRELNMIGELGERLVRGVCLVPGVSEVSLSEDEMLVVTRQNSALSRDAVKSQIAEVIQGIFPGANVLTAEERVRSATTA